MFENEREILTINEASKLMNISYGTLYKLIRQGAIPHKQIGRCIRIRKKDVISFMDDEK